MNKEISLKERQQLQLEMLVELDSICRKNNIKYSLAFGTLIGAIRHKGFIPWDDDVDIMMPYEDIIKLKNFLPTSTIEYLDVYNSKGYETSFPRIAHRGSIRIRTKSIHSYGVNIDLYPYFHLKYNHIEDVDKFRKFGKITSIIRQKADSLRIKLSKKFNISTYPFFSSIVKWTANYPISKIGDGKYYFVLGGQYGAGAVYDFDIFSDMTDVMFENHKFMSISEYDRYLRIGYGDYMTPPPVEKRVPYHGGKYYWK